VPILLRDSKVAIEFFFAVRIEKLSAPMSANFLKLDCDAALRHARGDPLDRARHAR
jgi:hypothetical protein